MDRVNWESAVLQHVLHILEDEHPPKVYVACTGAGAGLQHTLWRIPGISRMLVGTSFPYAPEATEEFLGFSPQSYVSEQTAFALAQAAYLRACAVEGPGLRVGLGVTASVTTNRAHRGEHRACIAVVTDSVASGITVFLRKDTEATSLHARGQDDLAVEVEALRLLFDRLGMPIEGTSPTGAIVRRTQDPALLSEVVFFSRSFFRADGTRWTYREGGQADFALFPGNFDPLHEGHRGMALSAEHYFKKPVVFQITADPPHKALLTVPEMLKRSRQFRGLNLLFTRGDSLYLDKARRNPGSTFVIGYDAAARMLDPQWGPEIRPMLAEFDKLNTRFYVYGRVMPDGVFRSVSYLDELVPKEYGHLFLGDHGSRWDVSSTELRVRT